jgi:hypothetical protein
MQANINHAINLLIDCPPQRILDEVMRVSLRLTSLGQTWVDYFDDFGHQGILWNMKDYGFHSKNGQSDYMAADILVLLGLFIYGLTVHVIPFITTLESQ